MWSSQGFRESSSPTSRTTLSELMQGTNWDRRKTPIFSSWVRANWGRVFGRRSETQPLKSWTSASWRTLMILVQLKASLISTRSYHRLLKTKLIGLSKQVLIRLHHHSSIFQRGMMRRPIGNFQWLPRDCRSNMKRLIRIMLSNPFREMVGEGLIACLQ